MRDQNETQPVVMTRAQAEAFTIALSESRRSLTGMISTVKRKRSWRPAERAMAIADYTVRLERLTDLYARISTTFQINGY